MIPAPEALERLREGNRRFVSDAAGASAYLGEARRAQLATLAESVGRPLVLVETTCSPETVAKRLAARSARGDSASDATLAIYRRQREAILATPPPLPAGAIEVRIDTEPEGGVRLSPALRALERAGILLPALSADGPVPTR